MADRYDEALRVLNETPAPDQWDDIQSRADAAATTEAHVIYLNGKRRGPRPGWPVLTAAAAVVVLALLGAITLTSRDTSTVVTDPGPASPPRRAETTTSEPRDPTTEPDTTTGTTREPEPDDVVPPASSPDDGTPSTDPSTTTGDGEATCLDERFSSSGAPPNMNSVQQPPTPNDPRVNETTWPYLIGVFESSETDERVVHVVASGGFGEDGGTWVQVADLGVEAWTAYSDSSGTGVAEVITTVNEVRPCTNTFFSSGLTEDEFLAFVTGLSHAG